MFKGLSNRMKQLLLEELYRRYDKLNRKLQSPFTKMHYADYEIQEIRDELRRIDEIILAIKED